MVDVAHHGHHRSARQRLGVRLHFVVGECLGVIQRGNHRGVAQLFDHDHGGVLVQRLVDGDHLAQLHQLLDDFAGLDRHFVRQLRHGNRLGHMDLDDARLRRSRHALVVIAVMTALATGSCAPVTGTPGSRTGITTGLEFFFLGGVAGPAAGELG